MNGTVLRGRRLFLSGVILLALLSLSGCKLAFAIFGYTGDDARDVLAAVMNVITDTQATSTTSYDATYGFGYSGTDGGDGVFSLDWQPGGFVTMSFAYYTPPASSLELHGTLTSGGEPGFWDTTEAQTSGYIFLVGEHGGNMYIDVKLHGDVVAANGHLSDDANSPVSFAGTIDDHQVEPEWGVTQIALDNHNLLIDLRTAAMAP
jgi:hypothetical protein